MGWFQNEEILVNYDVFVISTLVCLKIRNQSNSARDPISGGEGLDSIQPRCQTGRHCQHVTCHRLRLERFACLLISKRLSRKKLRDFGSYTQRQMIYPDVSVHLMTTSHAMVSQISSLKPRTQIESLQSSVVRSQIKNLYRFGERTKCDPKFQSFKICLSTKMMHPEERRETWIHRRAEWWANRRLGRSSEDVWDIREYVLAVVAGPTSVHFAEVPLTANLCQTFQDL